GDACVRSHAARPRWNGRSMSTPIACRAVAKVIASSMVHGSRACCGPPSRSSRPSGLLGGPVQGDPRRLAAAHLDPLRAPHAAGLPDAAAAPPTKLHLHPPPALPAP